MPLFPPWLSGAELLTGLALFAGGSLLGAFQVKPGVDPLRLARIPWLQRAHIRNGVRHGTLPDSGTQRQLAIKWAAREAKLGNLYIASGSATVLAIPFILGFVTFFGGVFVAVMVTILQALLLLFWILSTRQNFRRMGACKTLLTLVESGHYGPDKLGSKFAESKR